MFHENFEHMAAGFVAGASSVGISHPLDTVKTRLQTMPGYANAFDCAKKTLKYEGIRGFYKGMAFPLASMSFYNSLVFSVYQTSLAQVCKRRYGNSEAEGSYYDIALASVGAGAVSCCLGTPIDLIKIKLQVQTGSENNGKVSSKIKERILTVSEEPKKLSRSITTSSSNSKPVSVVTKQRLFPSTTNGPVRAAVEIWKTEGARGFYRGATSMLIRDIPGYVVYFVPFEFFSRMLAPEGRECTYFETARNAVVAGGLSGSISWGLMHPIDTIKSRLQADSSGKYKGFVDCVKKSISHDGWKFPFRGILVNMFRGFPQSAALFMGYEVTMKVFRGMDEEKEL